MSALDGADAAPRSQLPGSCSFEPVTKAENAPLSSSVFWVRCGAGVAQSVPPWLTTVSPSPPSKLLGLMVIAAEALTAAIAKSAHAARRAAKSARAIEIWEVMAIPCVRLSNFWTEPLVPLRPWGHRSSVSSLSPPHPAGYGARGSFAVDVSQRAARRTVRVHNRVNGPLAYPSRRPARTARARCRRRDRARRRNSRRGEEGLQRDHALALRQPERLRPDPDLAGQRRARDRAAEAQHRGPVAEQLHHSPQLDRPARRGGLVPGTHSRPAQRPPGVGALGEPRPASDGPHAAHREPAHSARDSLPQRPPRVPRAGGSRQGEHADSGWALLDSREARPLRRSRGLRTARLRDGRLLQQADRLAARRRGPDPRDERAAPRSRASVARVHPHAQRRHQAPRSAHADRHSAAYQVAPRRLRRLSCLGFSPGGKNESASPPVATSKAGGTGPVSATPGVPHCDSSVSAVGQPHRFSLPPCSPRSRAPRRPRPTTARSPTRRPAPRRRSSSTRPRSAC